MAYHNGMTGVFGLTDSGTEPALLRHYKRAIRSRTEIDSRPGNKFGHPVIGFSQELWPGYRRYADRALEAAMSTLTDSKTDELELPSVIWEFFGYPRRIVWPPTAGPSKVADTFSVRAVTGPHRKMTEADVSGTLLELGGGGQTGAATMFHVALDGRDNWSGMTAAPNAAGTDGPFATIARARDAVRRFRASARPSGPVLVRVHAGRYELTEPLIFKPEDSGTAQGPTIYVATPGNEGPVVISGGRVIRGWKR